MIYIAYATNDAAIVPMIVSQLEGAGLESWHRTEDWQPEIDARLAAADTLLAVMSPFARATDSVAYEWATALAQGTPVLLLILRATDLHPRQENLPTFDFTGGPQWEDLLAALQRNAGQPAQSPDEPAAEPAAQPASDVLAGAPDMVRTAFAELGRMDKADRQRALTNLAGMKHPAAAEALALAMEMPYRDVRLSAARALADRGDTRSIPGLLELIGEDDYNTVWDAAWGLVRIGGDEAVPGLIEAMRTNNAHTQKAASYALAQIGETAFESLLEARHAPDERVRLGAYEALGEIGEPAAQHIVADLAIDDEQVRRVASNLIEKIGEPTVIPLIRLLRSEDADTRKAAGKALVALGDTAVEGLSRGLRANNEQISRACVVLLERIDTDAALDALYEWKQENR